VQHYVWAGIGSFFIGVGMGLTSTSFIVAIQTTVPWEIRGIATAMNMFMRTMGSALGVAVLGGLLNSRINKIIQEAGMSANVTVDTIDKLLDKEELINLSRETVHILQQGLSEGLQYVYIGIGFVAVISMVCII